MRCCPDAKTVLGRSFVEIHGREEVVAVAMISQGRTESIWTPRGTRGAETQNILSTVGIFVVGKIRMVTQDCEEVKFSAPNHDAKVDLQSGLASVQISLTTSAPETRIHYRGSRARRLNGPRQGRQLRPAKGDSDIRSAIQKTGLLVAFPAQKGTATGRV